MNYENCEFFQKEEINNGFNSDIFDHPEYKITCLKDNCNTWPRKCAACYRRRKEDENEVVD